MRILYFTRDYTPHDHRFLSALAATDHSVALLRLERGQVQREDRALPPEIEWIPWRGGQRPLRLPDYPGLYAELRQILHDRKPDVIHAGPLPNCAFLAALAGAKPLVSMSWGSDLLLEARRSAWARRAVGFALRHTEILLGDCQAVRQEAAAYGFPEDRVMLFPWGVDLEHFTPAGKKKLRKRLGWEDEIVILSLRSWEPLYGVDLVVRAFARAARQEPRLRLILLGNGSQAPMIQRLIQQNDLAERVYLGGQVKNSDLPEVYRSADLYVSASHSDGSSVSLMEALACGLPALVSDIPGNKEWISEDKQGWLFPDGNEEALTAAILRAASDLQRLKQMGEKSRKLAEQRANWKENFQILLNAYQRAFDLQRGRLT